MLNKNDIKKGYIKSEESEGEVVHVLKDTNGNMLFKTARYDTLLKFIDKAEIKLININ